MRGPSHQSFVSLMYHNVCASPVVGGAWHGFENLSPSVTGYFVDREQFRQHCELVARDQSSMTNEELSAVKGESEQPANDDRQSERKPRVLITFDDGWRGTVDVGGPILEEHRLQALLFVTTDLIGHPHFVDRRLLQNMPDTFVVGSHARTHRLLAELSDVEVCSELENSKKCLEDILGREIDMIAYPGGSFDRRVLEMTAEAGYRMVFTSEPAVNRLSPRVSRYGRLAVKSGTSIETLERWLRGNVSRERIRAAGLQGAKRLLGRGGYRRLRSRLIAEDSTQLEMTDLAAAGCDAETHAIAVPSC